MRGLPALLALTVLAACASGAPPPPPPGTAQAVFVAPDTIRVTASDILPAQRVELVGPLGVLPAQQIDTTHAPAYAPGGSSVGIGLGAGGGGGHGFGFGGIGFGFPLGGSSVPAPYGGLVVSTALLRVPEPQSYAQTWPQTQVRIEFGAGPNARTLAVPAPAPAGG
jgi:hypothetical protein